MTKVKSVKPCKVSLRCVTSKQESKCRSNAITVCISQLQEDVFPLGRIRVNESQNRKTDTQNGRMHVAVFDDPRQVKQLKNYRINKLTKVRLGRKRAMRKLKEHKQTCCSRNEVLDRVVEYYQEPRKVSKPNRKKMRRSECKKAYKDRKSVV